MIRKWTTIGRSVGEFKEGDEGLSKAGIRIFKVEGLKRYFELGNLKGFYPAESFISFEDGEEK